MARTAQAKQKSILRLLFVDRTDAVLAALRRAAATTDGRAEIAWAGSLASLRDHLLSEHWDALICVCGNPGLTPQAVLRMTRELGLDLPCLALASEDQFKMAARALNAGVHDCISLEQPARMQRAIRREAAAARSRADHRAALELLRDSEDRFRALAANLPGMVFQLAGSSPADLRFLYASDGAYKLIGIRPKLLVSSFAHFHEAIDPNDRHAFFSAIAESANGLAVLNWEGRIRVRERQRPRWINLRSSPQRFSDGSIHWLGIASDITRSKETEANLRRSREQLSEFSSYLEAAKEEERERIARDIHDELGSILVAMKIEASLLASKLPESAPKLRDKARAIESLLDQAMGTAGRVARELRPGILKEFGLPAAIESQAEDFTQRTGIPCRVDYDEDVELDERRSLALFRISQEALTNIAKHAHASMVALRLWQDGRYAVLEVFDNGRGISDADFNKAKSFGLRGIRERARNLDGEFHIAPGAQGGSHLQVRLPLKAAQVAGERAPQQNLF